MLSQRAQKMKPSATLVLAAKAKELKAAGHDVISLSVGEPDWATFDVICDAGIEAIKNGQTKYQPAAGTMSLRQAIAEQTSKDIGLDYQAKEVSVTTGAKFVVFGACQMLLDPGDEVIIPAPYWVSYPTMVELAEGTPVTVPCGKEVNFKINGALLKQALTDKTKAIIFNSPSNPTGQIYNKEELAEIAEVLREHPRVVLICDDIYNRLVFDGSGLAPHILQVAPDLRDRTLLINGVSKSYSMTGWRVGWSVGPEKLIKALSDYQSQSVSNASSISLAAAEAAIKKADKDVADSLGVLKERLDLAMEELQKIPGLEVERPGGAFYIWPNVESYLGKSYRGQKLETTREISQILLEEKKVAVVPGIEFGLEGYVRISYALGKERMLEAIGRIKEFLAEVK